MPFTAQLQSIEVQGSGFDVVVEFLDSATGFEATKNYTFPADGSVTQADILNRIRADAQGVKASLITINQIRSHQGDVITI